MDELNLPIFKKPLPEPKHLTMDDYLRFVLLNLEYTVDLEAVRKSKKLSAVNVAFSLRNF